MSETCAFEIGQPLACAWQVVPIGLVWSVRRFALGLVRANQPNRKRELLPSQRLATPEIGEIGAYLLFGAAHIFHGFSIDDDLLAGGNERRHQHAHAVFQQGRLVGR